MLSVQERRLLLRWARGVGTTASVAARARLILDCAAGGTRAEVARRHGTSAHRVGRWCCRFVAQRHLGLVDVERRGARLVLGGEACQRVLAQIRAGVTTTHALARACGVSQPTASRLRRVCALHPNWHAALPASLRLVNAELQQPLGVLIEVGIRVLLLGAHQTAAATLPQTTAVVARMHRLRRVATATRRRRAGLKLRRFLRASLRTHGGPLSAIVVVRGAVGPAVKRTLAKHPRLSWYRVGTEANWLCLTTAWLSHRCSDAPHQSAVSLPNRPV